MMTVLVKRWSWTLLLRLLPIQAYLSLADMLDSTGVTEACAKYVKETVLLKVPPSSFAALGPLLAGGLCGNLPRNLRPQGGMVTVVDASEWWPRDERDRFRRAEQLYRTNGFMMVPAGFSCTGCVAASSCLDGDTIAALLLLLLHLGADAVHYSKLRHGSPQRPVFQSARCRNFGSTVEAIYAPSGAELMLQYWLHGGRFWPERCTGGRRGLSPTQAMVAEGADKGYKEGAPSWHAYTRLYDQLFPSRQCLFRNVLEVGIGTPQTMAHMGATYSPGASLRAWRAVFPLANVTGLDIDRRVVEQARSARIHTHLCNSMNETQVRESLGDVDRFDFIVDDGAHRHDVQLRTWKNLWPYLRPGGLYVIEDVTTEEGAMAVADMVQNALAVTTKSRKIWLVAAAKADASSEQVV